MYDAAVIGAGPAGYKTALKLASAGKKVCLIEKSKDKIGGTCLNSGCIPVKSIIESAIIYEKMKKAHLFGIKCSLSPPEMAEITGAAIKNISELKKGLNFLLKKSGVDIIYGKASFKNEKELTVEGRPSVRAESIILCTGSAPRVISSIDIDGKNIINSSHLLDIKRLPETILLIGGGYIGLELACAFSSMGSKVTVIEKLPRILTDEDPAVTDALRRIMSRKGIEIICNTQVLSARTSGNKVNVKLKKEEEFFATFDKVISAAGRAPSTEGLNLEKAGIETQQNKITVDQKMQTSTPGIYAAGDVNGRLMLAHTAYREAEIAAASLCGVSTPKIDYHTIPRVVFTSPQLACIGLTPELAKKEGKEISEKKIFFRSNAKALIKKESEGFIKITCDKKSGALLGVNILGPEASELIHIFTPCIAGKLPLKELKSLVYAHPTLSEIISEL